MAIGPILIIEDDAELSLSLSDMIRELGYRAIRASNGREALAHLREVTPSLMLVDLFMPVMNGIEFLHALKRDPTLSTIPRVIMTAANDQMVGVKEDVSVLYKPFDPEVLAQVLEQHCAHCDGAPDRRDVEVRVVSRRPPLEPARLPGRLGEPISDPGGQAMARSSSKPSDRNWKPSDAASKIDESWKTRPSSETTSDEGPNAELARERQRDENAPLGRSPAARRTRKSG